MDNCQKLVSKHCIFVLNITELILIRTHPIAPLDFAPLHDDEDIFVARYAATVHAVHVQLT